MSRNTLIPMGYLADNWLGANENTPALIVNPEASPIDLLAWVGGELKSIEASCNALSDMAPGKNAGIEFAEFEAMFIHRLAPVVRVLDLALCELIAQRLGTPAHESTAVNGGC